MWQGDNLLKFWSTLLVTLEKYISSIINLNFIMFFWWRIQYIPDKWVQTAKMECKRMILAFRPKNSGNSVIRNSNIYR